MKMAGTKYDEEVKSMAKANDSQNLAALACTMRKFAHKYSIDRLISDYDGKNPPECVAFWHEYGENGIFSQWHKTSFNFNGRQYVTAEQYMMSEKALLFEDFESYKKIMAEADPKKCKSLGQRVTNFDQRKWDENFRGIIFMGNFLRAQYDTEFLNSLLETKDALLIEASPFDDIYGAGLEKPDLLDNSGHLKLAPDKWRKDGSVKQTQNNLGFVLMGLRDFYGTFQG